jgi:hypothetical protein
LLFKQLGMMVAANSRLFDPRGGELVSKGDLPADFARWRGRIPDEARQVTGSADELALMQIPVELGTWLQRTRDARCRIAYCLGTQWWAYLIIDSRKNASVQPDEDAYFVIASSDIRDPEWGADHVYNTDRNEWKVADWNIEATRTRLSSSRSKA